MVPIRVRIGLDHKGHHAYPPFNTLPHGVRQGMDWARFIDRHGGWLYDRKHGHAADTPESPRGFWFGVIIVPELFAAESADRWPNDIEVLDETEVARFYEERVSHQQPEIIDDLETLQAIAAKRAIGLSETQDDINALDPDHEARGRRRNAEKTWAGFRSSRGLAIAFDAVARAKAKRAEALARVNRG